MVLELNGKAFLSWDDIEKQVDRLAEQINRMDKKPFYLYGVPRGGLIPATWLSHKTGIKYQTPLIIFLENMRLFKKSIVH